MRFVRRYLSRRVPKRSVLGSSEVPRNIFREAATDDSSAEKREYESDGNEPVTGVTKQLRAVHSRGFTIQRNETIAASLFLDRHNQHKT